jgi:hypothetical protein
MKLFSICTGTYISYKAKVSIYIYTECWFVFLHAILYSYNLVKLTFDVKTLIHYVLLDTTIASDPEDSDIYESDVESVLSSFKPSSESENECDLSESEGEGDEGEFDALAQW